MLGNVDAIFGVTWTYLGAILGNVRAILGLCGRSWVYLGSTLELRVEGLGFEVWGLGFDDHNAYLVEMPKSLSTYACAAKTLT